MFSSCLAWGAGRGPLPGQWAVEALCSCLWGPAKANGVGTGRRVVLTNPQTTLPAGGAPLLGLIVVARQRPGVKVPLFQAFLPCGGIFFVDEFSALPCAWGNNGGSQGAVCSVLFQISFPHQPDHKPGSPAEAGGAAWPLGAGRRRRDARPSAGRLLCGLGLAPSWAWPPSLGCLDLRLKLLVPLKCSMLDGCWFGGWVRAQQKQHYCLPT